MERLCPCPQGPQTGSSCSKATAGAEPGHGYTNNAVRRLGITSLLLPLALGLASGEPGEEAAFAERPPEHSELVDEDEDFARPKQTYAFNPVQATKELKVGNYYFKKGSYAAAASRYLEATRWDDNFADAYWRLAITHERLKNPREAIDAYTRYLALDPTGKKAREARRQLERMEQSLGTLPLAASGDQAGDAK